MVVARKKVNRPNRKATDEDILTLNSVGISLATIGRITGVHPTSVSSRLRTLGVEPADTRRSFMEDVVSNLSPDQQEWLTKQVNDQHTIKDFVLELIIQKFNTGAKP